MKKWIIAIALILNMGFAQAQSNKPIWNVYSCETCVKDVDWGRAAADGLMNLTGQPLGYIYVGNPRTAEIRGFAVNLVHQSGQPLPYGFTSMTLPQSVRNEYS